MAKKEVNANPAEVRKKVEEINNAAGYDVPVAVAMLNTMRVMTHADSQLEMPVCQVDAAVIADAVVRTFNGKIDGLPMLMELSMSYGWHLAKSGKSMLRDVKMREHMLALVDEKEGMTIAEKAERKRAIAMGFEAIDEAVAKIQKLYLRKDTSAADLMKSSATETGGKK